MLLDEIASVLKAPSFTAPNAGAASLSSFYLSYNSKPGCILNLAHAFWQHSSVVELTLLARFSPCNCHHYQYASTTYSTMLAYPDVQCSLCSTCSGVCYLSVGATLMYSRHVQARLGRQQVLCFPTAVVSIATAPSNL